MAIFNSLGSNYLPKHLLHMLTGFDGSSKRKLETYLSDRYDAKVQLTYKGREALYLALKNARIVPGDHVVVNGYTCYAVYDAVVAAGMVPVYVDIAKDSLNFDLKALKAAVKKDKKIKAVIIQNTLGFPVDMKSIEEFTHKNKLHLIEDLAHSIGLVYPDGREAGTVADAALSFSQDKVVDAVSGGAYIYRGKQRKFDSKRLKYLRFLKDYYYIWNTTFIRSGYIWGGGKLYAYGLRKLRLMPRPMDGAAKNVRRPDIWHASLALKQFHDLEKNTDHRRAIAELYRQNLPKKIQMSHHENANYLRFPIQVDDPASLIKFLASKRIYVSDTWYDSPISPKRTMSQTNYESGMCPRAEKVSARMVNLPTHVNVDLDAAEDITAKVNEWLSKQDQ